MSFETRKVNQLQIMARRKKSKAVLSTKSGKEEYVKSGARNTRGKEKFDESKKDGIHSKYGMDKTTACNDVSWYSKSTNLLDAAASLPYGYPIGNPINIDNSNFSRYPNPGNRYDAVPGIMTIALLTGPGIATDVNSPVNVAARDIYSYVRYANSGHANYDPVDLMMYILAWDEVSMWLANARRVYGAMYTYNSQNKYAPKYLVEALGFDYNDLNANLAQFRYAINAATNRFNALNMPNNFDYITRHTWLYSNIYSDGTSAKSQLYAYVPAAYRVYDETSSTNGGFLDAHPLTMYAGNGALTFTEWLNITNDMINSLLGSEDVGIISGDILKAFGSERTIITPTIADVYSISPVYNEEVLSQFQNATVLNALRPTPGYEHLWDITQDPSVDQGVIQYNPKFTITYQGGNSAIASNANRVLSLNLNDPKPGDTMVASRLMTITNNENSPKPGESYNLSCLTAGTEIAVRGYISVGKRASVADKVTYSMSYHSVGMNFSYNTKAQDAPIVLSGMISALANVSAFKYHPMDTTTVYDYVSGSDPSRGTVHYFFEVDNYTIIELNTLKQMHETAILSEFDVPITFKTTGTV